MYNYRYINLEDPIYQQVLELRYNEFFKRFSTSRDIVIDEDENNAIHLVCTENNNLIGYCRLVLKDNIAYLSQIVVDEKYRCKGIGRKLINTNEHKAKDLGAAEIRLNAKVELLDFYKKLGYTSVGDVFPSKKTGLPHQTLMKKVG